MHRHLERPLEAAPSKIHDADVSAYLSIHLSKCIFNCHVEIYKLVYIPYNFQNKILQLAFPITISKIGFNSPCLL